MDKQTRISLGRLSSQWVAAPATDDPAEVVRWMGALQAQDYLGALWAVGVRTTGAGERAVAQALAEGRIVRTWPMRGTIHMVAPEDVRWMLALLTPRVVQRSRGRLAQLGIDEATLAASGRALVAALEGGRHRTRRALFEALEAAGISAAGQRGIHILGQHAQDGLICFGAHDGKQPTFTLLDEWVPPAPAPGRDEALATLARRYFRSHGPATLQDFCWWSGLAVADARAGLGAVAGELASLELDGQRYHYDEAAAAPAGDRAQPMLLPPFDEFLIAYRDRAASLDPAHRDRVVPGANGIFHPIVVMGGRVVGTWRRTLRARSVELAFHPFDGWRPGERASLDAAAERYGRFLGLPVTEAADDAR